MYSSAHSIPSSDNAGTLVNSDSESFKIEQQQPIGSGNVTASIINAGNPHQAQPLQSSGRPGSYGSTLAPSGLTASSVQATSRRNYELYARSTDMTPSSVFGASPRTAPTSNAGKGRYDTKIDATARFFDVDAPALPVQPLRMTGASNSTSPASSL